MSFLICRIQKYKKSDLQAIQYHNQRQTKGSSNLDIDKERSHLNYDLINKEPISYTQAFNQRLKELKPEKTIRKDAVAMVGILVTSDKDFFDKLHRNRQRFFFEDSLDFLKRKYGKENIVSANVHMDEKTPHMHVQVIPVNQDNKLSAKTIFNRQGLQKLQDEFHKSVGSSYRLDRGERRRDKQRYHIEINEFKKQTLETRKKEIQKEIENLYPKTAHIEHFKPENYNFRPAMGKNIKIKEKDFVRLYNDIMDVFSFRANYEKQIKEDKERIKALEKENEEKVSIQELEKSKEVLKNVIRNRERDIELRDSMIDKRDNFIKNMNLEREFKVSLSKQAILKKQYEQSR